MLARRLALTLTTAAALTGAGASVARADIGFLVMPGFSGVEIDGDAEAGKLELVRDGAVIASSDDGAVFVDELEAGDIARAYDADGTPAGSVTYDGTPGISDACAGGSTFTATRGAAAVFQYAGAFTGSALEPLTATWDGGQTARVTLSGPLAEDDMVFVSAGRDDVEPAYSSTRMAPAEVCSKAPGATPTPTPAPHTQPGAPNPSQPGKLSLTATRAALAKAKLRATFIPSRAGAEPQRASVKVTLRGSSSRA
jgi:hypothetical protein